MVEVKVSDIEPVKTLITAVANAYPCLVSLRHDHAEIGLLVESIDTFRVDIEKPTR